MSNVNSFGQRLRRLRKERDLTQEALAQTAFCSQDMIKKLELGVRRPSRQLAASLADTLGLDATARTEFLAAARQHGEPADEPALAAAPTLLLRRLPAAVTPFIGRERELADLTVRLCDSATRLLTLIAPGGMGKTRLALAVAEHLANGERFANGVAFAGLAPLSDASSLEPTLADALGLPLETDNRRPPRSQLLDYLREKQLLLVLDNCEHLREPVADLARVIIAEAPGITLLATSRERLDVRAEQLLPLDGMISDVDGVVLFAATARSVQPAFVVDDATRPQITAICTYLGGMPLAIELAAAWADTLSLREIDAELRRGVDLLQTHLADVPERQRSVRAVFDMTWERLSVGERDVFAHLAMIRRSANRHALQAITSADLATLKALIGKAFLRYDPDVERYSIHELLRQYAADRLADQPGATEAAHQRHAAYYLGMLAGYEAALKGGGNQRRTLDHIAADFENILAAWSWATDAGQVDLLTPACHALGIFCDWQGRHAEGLEAFVRISAAAQPCHDATAVQMQICAYAWQGVFQQRLNRIDAAQQAFDQADQLLMLEPNHGLTAFVGLQQGNLVMRADFETAHAAYTRSIDAARQCADRWIEAQALAGMGIIYHMLIADFAEAARYWDTSLAIQESIGDQFGCIGTLADLSMNRRYIGLLEESLDLAQQSYELAVRVGTPLQQAYALNNLGSSYTWLGLYERSRLHHEQALRIYHALGTRSRLADVQGRLSHALIWSGHADEAVPLLDEALKLARATGDTISEHIALLALCNSPFSARYPDRGRRLRNESVRLARERGVYQALVLMLAAGAIVERQAGDRAAARRWALAALRNGVDHHIWQGLITAIQAVALLLYDDGELERAIELSALFAREHRDNRLTRSSVEQAIYWDDLEPAFAALPPDVIAAARARGEQRDLWATGRELLAELEAAGWGERDEG